MMFTHFPTVRNEKYIENVEEIFFDIQFHTYQNILRFNKENEKMYSLNIVQTYKRAIETEAKFSQ